MNSDVCTYIPLLEPSFHVHIGYAYPVNVILQPCYLNVFKYFVGFNENAKSAYTQLLENRSALYLCFNSVLFIAGSALRLSFFAPILTLCAL